MTQLSADDRFEILDVLAAYCQCFDDHDATGFGEVFTSDAEIEIQGNPPIVYRGREDIVAWAMRYFAARTAPCLHLVGNARISAGDDVTGLVDYLFFISEPGAGVGLSTAGRYQDVYAQQDGRWCISKRFVGFLGGAT
jgi:uncharacterized protein (TIGR02246 family)